MVETDNELLSNRDVEMVSELNVELVSAVCVWVPVDINSEETINSSKLTEEFTEATAETELVVIEVTGVLTATEGVGDAAKDDELVGREPAKEKKYHKLSGYTKYRHAHDKQLCDNGL